MVLAGSKSYIYYGTSSTFKGGDRSVDTHMAFNPMIKSIDFPESMRYVLEGIHTFESLDIKINFDKELGEGEVRFRCHFRDPIPLSKIFTYKGVTTSWTGTGDQLTFNFSNRNDIDKNIWVSLHLEDQSGSSNHLDLFLDGGEMTTYKISGSQGQPVIEEFTIKFAEISVGTLTTSVAYAPNMTTGFDDGSFNQTGVAEVTVITLPAASAITTGQYFKIWLANGTGGWTAYYVWFNKDGGGGDPAPTGYTGISVVISTGNTATQVATAVGSALDGAADNFGTPTIDGGNCTVTQQQTGDIPDCVNNDVGTGFSVSISTQGVTAVNGGWSLWDGAYTSVDCVMTVDCTLTWGSAFSDMDVQEFSFEIEAPKEAYRQYGSLTVQNRYLGKRSPFKGSVTGIITKGNVNLAEPSKTLANKTSATLKLLYGTTKYFQFTSAVIVKASAPGIESGKPVEGTFELEGKAGSVFTYNWTANESTDPSAHIEHTNL